MDKDQYISSLEREISRVKVERDEWRHQVGLICATIPVSKIADACMTIGDLLEYFQGLHDLAQGVHKRMGQDIAGTPFTDKDAEKVVRAFWRRIYGYRNDYGKELPDDCPVEFVASMGTALSALNLEFAGYTNEDQLQYAKEDVGCFYQDTDGGCEIKLLAGR